MVWREKNNKSKQKKKAARHNKETTPNNGTGNEKSQHPVPESSDHQTDEDCGQTKGAQDPADEDILSEYTDLSPQEKSLESGEPVSVEKDGNIYPEDNKTSDRGDLFDHESINENNLSCKAPCKATHKKWKTASKSIIRGEMLDTLLNKRPAVRHLEIGFSLDTIPDAFGRYNSPWNARNFANKFSSEFSSFKVVENREEHIGEVDFVSDWENIKSLITTPFTNDSRSFLLHKVGKSIFVDQFDLKKLFRPPYYQGWSRFRDFSKDLCHSQKMDIIQEGKSEREILSKGYMHKLIYFGVQQNMDIGNPSKKTLCKDLPVLAPEIPLEGNRKNFLHKVSWKVGGFTIFTGTDIPICKEALADESATVTLRVNDGSPSENLNLLDGLDMWLDNLLLNISKTLVTHHENGIVNSDEWIDTESFPVRASFNPDIMMEEGPNILKHLKSEVTENGHTYWLYKPHGSNELKIFDLTAKQELQDNAESNPYELAFATFLYKTVIAVKNSIKISTAESMLRHVSHLTLKQYPLVSIACIGLIAELRLPENRKLIELNGTMRTKFSYDWSEEALFHVFGEPMESKWQYIWEALSFFEKLDNGDKKAFKELNQIFENSNNNLNNDASQEDDLDIQFTDKTLYAIERFLHSKKQLLRHLPKSKYAGLSIFKIPSGNLQDSSGDLESRGLKAKKLSAVEVKRIQKYAVQLQRDKFKELNQRVLESNNPLISEKRYQHLEKIKAMKFQSGGLDPEKWICMATSVRLILELSSCLISLQNICNDETGFKNSLQILLRRKLSSACCNLATWNNSGKEIDLAYFLHGIILKTNLLHCNARIESDTKCMAASAAVECLRTNLGQLMHLKTLEDLTPHVRLIQDDFQPSPFNDSTLLNFIRVYTEKLKSFETIGTSPCLDVPVLGKVGCGKSLVEWCSNVLLQFRYVEVSGTINPVKTADILYSQANALFNSFQAFKKANHELTEYLSTRNRLLVSISLYHESLSRYLEATNTLPCHKMVIAATNMHMSYLQVLRCCSCQPTALNNETLSFLAEAFNNTKDILMKVSQMKCVFSNSCTGDRGGFACNKIFWTLSDFHFHQAMFLLQFRPAHLDIIKPKKKAFSYIDILKELNASKDYMIKSRSKKCAFTDKITDRETIIWELEMEICTNQIIIELNHEYTDVTERWEPLTSDLNLILWEQISPEHITSKDSKSCIRTLPLSVKFHLEQGLSKTKQYYNLLLTIHQESYDFGLRSLKALLKIQDLERLSRINTLDSTQTEMEKRQFEFFFYQALLDRLKIFKEAKWTLVVGQNRLKRTECPFAWKKQGVGFNHDLYYQPYMILMRIAIRLYKDFSYSGKAETEINLSKTKENEKNPLTESEIAEDEEKLRKMSKAVEIFAIKYQVKTLNVGGKMTEKHTLIRKFLGFKFRLQVETGDQVKTLLTDITDAILILETLVVNHRSFNKDTTLLAENTSLIPKSGNQIVKELVTEKNDHDILEMAKGNSENLKENQGGKENKDPDSKTSLLNTPAISEASAIEHLLANIKLQCPEPITNDNMPGSSNNNQLKNNDSSLNTRNKTKKKKGKKK